jgi:hypothetical protein
MKASAKLQLEKAIDAGESWAISAVINRLEPTLKPSTDPNSIDAALIDIKIEEHTELISRIDALEASLNELTN